MNTRNRIRLIALFLLLAFITISCEIDGSDGVIISEEDRVTLAFEVAFYWFTRGGSQEYYVDDDGTYFGSGVFIVNQEWFDMYESDIDGSLAFMEDFLTEIAPADTSDYDFTFLTLGTTVGYKMEAPSEELPEKYVLTVKGKKIPGSLVTLELIFSGSDDEYEMVNILVNDQPLREI